MESNKIETEEHRELRRLFKRQTGDYVVFNNRKYILWLENELIKKSTIHDVVVPKGTLFCGNCDKYITCKDLLEDYTKEKVKWIRKNY